MPRVVILGVDPGFANIGLLATKVTKTKRTVKLARFIGTKPAGKKRKMRDADDDTRRLEEIRVAFGRTLAEVCPNVVAMERVPRLRNPKATRQCALAWSAMYTVARERGLVVLVYDTDEVKTAVTGKKNASKESMTKCLKAMFPTFKDWPEGSKVEHVCDAGGAAICAESDPAVELLLQERR
jgi:crossover junction endodeoxyribonuclease RuvC